MGAQSVTPPTACMLIGAIFPSPHISLVHIHILGTVVVNAVEDG